MVVATILINFTIIVCMHAFGQVGVVVKASAKKQSSGVSTVSNAHLQAFGTIWIDRKLFGEKLGRDDNWGTLFTSQF